ncbi:MAG: N-acetylmuramoyl-L-alanine amidase [Magnetococcales bacterium]|nr:N-acetylmuramoyl-L-alanine amidase [Magnetococcales bacterium]
MPWKLRKYTDRLIIHCAATPPSMDIGVKTINRWHKQRGWKGVGYHKILRRNGEIENGRPLDVYGAHARRYNGRSIGICLIGGVQEGDHKKTEANYTSTQWQSLERLIRNLMDRFPGVKVIGHKEVSQTACPCFDVTSWASTLQAS